MPSFNPFDKDLKDLLVQDLAILRSTAEGWYVEYKREVPQASSIAKSVSSFANQYGGWLFYGVEAASKGDNVATAFPGVPVEDWPALQQRISSAVSAYLSPHPYFEPRLVPGPDQDLGLPAGSGVVVIRVPLGFDAPYLHSSGRVYRRVADQSHPIYERDRSVLDILWARKEKAEADFRDFLERETIVSESESQLPRLTVFLFADPRGDRRLVSRLDMDEFREIAISKEGGFGEIPFDSVFSASSGYMARQVMNNDPYLMVPTLRHFFNGTTVADIALRSAQIAEPLSDHLLAGYEHGPSFLEKARKGRLGSARWIDLNLLLHLIAGVLSKHAKCVEAGGIFGSTHLKIRFTSVWRCVPFVDTASYLERFDGHLLPILQDDEIWAPPSKRIDSLLLVTTDVETDSEVYAPPELMRAIGAWGMCLRALGLENLLKVGGIAELVTAASRAVIVHRGDPRREDIDL